jgi:acetolactate synthase-1/2/3 large subunit
MRTVARFIIDTLAAHGIDRVFCVPGESFLGLLDALHDRADIDTVVCRHEGGAGFMALADARLTGRPGVALVSRGPGASNAAIAVHTAQQDAVAFLLLVGQVAAADLRRDAFQEVDYRRMFGGQAKWVAEVADPARIPEVMLRALRVATSGLPGPVVVALPEDVALATVASPPLPPQAAHQAAPAPADVVTLRQWLGAAERPLVIAGSAFEREGGREALRAFAEAWRVPVAVSFRRQDLFPNRHDLYAGDLGLANPAAQMAAFRAADPLVVLGARLSDITTQGYTFPELVRPRMRLVHVHADPGVIGTHFATDLALACDPRALLDTLGAPAAPPPVEREQWVAQLRSEREAIAAPNHFAVTDGVAFERVVAAIGAALPADAIVTVDAGNFGAPVYRVVPFAPPQRLLAPISGAMGFGVPAAVAAALRAPGRPVICFVGDGGFLMTGNELAVALERRLALKVVLAENGVYGSIRVHQARQFPGRLTGTGFVNPDLGLIAQAFGFALTRIDTEADLAALPRALHAPGPGFILVRSSLAAIMPAPARPARALAAD